MSELGKITTQQRFNRVQEDLDLIYNRLKETADELQDSRARVAELEAQTPSALKAKLESAEARITELEGVNDMLDQRNARYLAALTEIGEQDENALVYLPTAYLKGNHARKAIH